MSSAGSFASTATGGCWRGPRSKRLHKWSANASAHGRKWEKLSACSCEGSLRRRQASKPLDFVCKSSIPRRSLGYLFISASLPAKALRKRPFLPCPPGSTFFVPTPSLDADPFWASPPPFTDASCRELLSIDLPLLRPFVKTWNLSRSFSWSLFSCAVTCAHPLMDLAKTRDFACNFGCSLFSCAVTCARTH